MKPLAGRRILITRARDQAQSLAEALEEQGAELLAIPAIEIVPPDSYASLDAALRDADKYQWLIVTSAHGAEVLAARLHALGLSHDGLSRCKIAAIGPATARALEQHGLHADLIPRQAIAESLVEALRQQVAGQRILLVRAKIARDVIPDDLRAAGAAVEIAEAYRTVVPVASAAALRQALVSSDRLPDAVTFTSSSTVTNFFRLLREAGIQRWPASIAAISIGPITSRTLRQQGIEPAVEAAEFTIPGLIAALCVWSAA